MRFLEEGPDVPDELLEAQEGGDVVFLCGAGISMRAGLPGFEGLTQSLHGECGVMRAHKGRIPLDRELDLLERKVPRRILVDRIAAHLEPAGTSPVLDTHEAILTLGRDERGAPRVVTTNFDSLFERADPAASVHPAPLLPVPKPGKWRGIVHLHGRLDPGSDPEDRHLVFTAADFGTAYLVEGWARRFVLELFRHYTVVFVGYAASDPVVHYLLDALAAERRIDPGIGEAYAFVPQDAVDEYEAHIFRTPGVVPIPYDPRESHEMLHGTLHGWAALMRDGLRPRRTLLRRLASSQPPALPAYEIERLRWILSEPTGTLIAEFSGLGRSTPVSWLRHLAPNGTVRIRPRKSRSAEVPLVDGGGRAASVAPLSVHGRALAYWLRSHLESPEAIEWALECGGCLHPELREIVERMLLGDTPPRSPYREAWDVLVSPRTGRRDGSRLGSYLLVDRLKKAPWSPLLRLRLLRELTPVLQLAPRARPSVEALRREIRDVHDLLGGECILPCDGHHRELARALRARADAEVALRELASELTELLRQACELWALCENPAFLPWLTEIHFPDLFAEGDEDSRHHSWTILLALARDAFESVRRRSEAAARELVSTWLSQPFSVFRRLAAFAADRLAVAVPDVGAAVVGSPLEWLWGALPSHEEVRLLRILWKDLPTSARDALAAAILRGPERGLGPKRADETEERSRRARDVWLRLAALRADGLALDGRALRAFERLSRRHPEWGTPDASALEEVRRPRAVWRRASETLVSELAGMGPRQLADALVQPVADPEEFSDAWRQAAEKRPTRALAALRRLLARNALDPIVWGGGLQALSRKPVRSARIRKFLRELLRRLPPELRDRLVHAVCLLVRGLAAAGAPDEEASLLALWDETLPTTLAVRALRNDDPVLVAINHPCGILAEALLKLLFAEPRNPRSGIPDPIRPRVTHLAVAQEEGCRWARVVLASRLHPLHVVDPDWTRQHLLPQFDWKSAPDPRAAWQAFLWAPQLTPALWGDLKAYFLETLDHYREFDREWRRPLPQIVAETAIHVADALSVDESRACLVRLDDGGRAEVADRLAEILDGAGEDAAKLWAGRVGPWIGGAWPMTFETRGPHASAALARVAVAAKRSFPDAVEAIMPYLVAMDPDRSFYEELSGTDIPGKFPDACLRLLDRVTPEAAEPWKLEGLGNVLRAVKGTAPGLATRAEFIRLRTLAERSGQGDIDG